MWIFILISWSFAFRCHVDSQDTNITSDLVHHSSVTEPFYGTTLPQDGTTTEDFSTKIEDSSTTPEASTTTIEVTTEGLRNWTEYSVWSYCYVDWYSMDWNCVGKRQRTVTTFTSKGGAIINTEYKWETGQCLLTTRKVNGRYTQWTHWDDCSGKCTGGITYRFRYCNNPTPCNGGKDCTQLGADTIVKNCGPVNGQWGDWLNWGHCDTGNSTSTYGTGTRERIRKCNNPSPQCFGEYCVGAANETGNCRNIPPCLTDRIFEEKFLKSDNPMIIYTSAQVEIYPLTKNKCTMETIIYNYWKLYYVNSTTGIETKIGKKTKTLKFKLKAWEHEIGLYRLYTKIGYPSNFEHWMDESMYIRIMHPPPHASINGATGRTIGEGKTEFDARSVSYSLTNGPGNPIGLEFAWSCLRFLSRSLYKLLQLSIDPVIVFADETGAEKKWYHSGVTNYISDQVAWLGASTLYGRVMYLKSLNSTCSNADNIYVKVASGSFQSLEISTTGLETSTTGLSDHSSTISYSDQTIPNYDLIPLTGYYDIKYLKDIDSSTVPHDSPVDVLDLPDYTELVTNELYTFLDFFYGENRTSLINDTLDFFQTLSDSFLTLQSISLLEGLDDLPPSADANFFSNLNSWLKIAEEGIVITEVAGPQLVQFDDFYQHVILGREVIDYIGIDEFMRLQIDSSGTCLLDFLGTLFEGFYHFNKYDWYDMKVKEIFYMQWIKDVLLNTSKCDQFTGNDNGTSSLDVTTSDVNFGVGFLVNVRVEFKGSISYFVQHAQSVSGNPPALSLECRLNCMKKTALTSITSLKAACPLCTLNQLRESTFRWNMKNFNIYTREATNNTQWQSWMLSDVNSTKFVMSANVLEANTGYLIEAEMEFSTGEISTGIWMITTNILLYEGSCEIEDGIWVGEKKVTAFSWKDEGFRNSKDRTLDWKEQLNYRVVQPTEGGKELMLNYGSEAETYIKVNPGVAELQYEVSIKVQIVDIFKDYTECVINLGQIMPDYVIGNPTSVSTFLIDATNNVDYYWQSGNIKQTAMNIEVGSTSVKDLDVSTTTILDTDPNDWVNIGVETLNDGSTVTRSFEELMDMYYKSDADSQQSNNDIIDKLINFVEILDVAANETDSGSTVNIAQIVNSIGTTVINKQFVNNSSASKAFQGNANLLAKFVTLTKNENYLKYEDFVSVCEGILRVLHNALEGLLTESSQHIPTDLDLYSIQEVLDDRQAFSDSKDSDLTLMEKAFIASQIAKKNELNAEPKDNIVKNEVPGLMKTILTLGDVLGELNFRKQLPVFVKHQHINSSKDKIDMLDLLDKGIKHADVDINFQESSSMSTAEQDVQVTLYDHTPFTWDKESKYINSKTVTISAGDTSVIPNNIKLPNSNETSLAKTVQLALPADTSESTSQIIVYKMYWQNYQDSLIFSIRNALSYLQYNVYILKNEQPTEENYDWKKVIDQNDWLSSDEVKVVVEGGLYTKSTLVYISVDVSYTPTGFISTNTSTNTSSTNGTMLVYHYITGITTGCRVWDDTNDRWDKSSCKVSKTSTIADTICVCANPPGNSFATTFFVAPNTIDFGSVFSKFDLKNNAAVFATVISLLLLYIIICIWAIRQDKKDISRWAISYLVDNVECDEYVYMITVYTGLHRHARTKSNISFIIVDGKDKKYRNLNVAVRRLDDEYHQGFDVGSVRRFVMCTDKRIEDPSFMKIWHDNSGTGYDASWYLSKIVLEDIQTQKKFVFKFDTWLSLDNDDGYIESIVPVQNKADLKQFSFVFNEKTRQNTTDNHLWLSVAIRPEESNFTRMQRLACCLALLFLTMIANAMFYGQDNGKVISIGPINISLTSIYISIVTAIIAALPIVLLTYLFRNAKRSPQKSAKYVYVTDSENKTFKSRLTVPYWYRYLAWGIVTLSVLVPGFFLILYSMEWGKTKSENWLLAFFLSFFESILIVDPFKILLLSVLSSWILSNNNSDESLQYDREELLREAKSRAISSTNFFIAAFRQVKAPIQPDQVDKLKKQRKEKLIIEKTFIQLMLYLVFLFVLYLISFSNRDPDWFYVKNHIDQHLLSSRNVKKGDYTLRFNQVKTASNFFVWADETLLPFMFPRYALNRVPLKANQRLFIQDNVNYRVGPLRLRQVRTKEESCHSDQMGVTSCYDEYSINDEDDRSFCVGWEYGPCVRGHSLYNITHAAWTYVSPFDVWGLPTTGLHTTYGGGGYISDFAVNYNISAQMLDDLIKYKWIDRKTRAVFTEFSLYNANNNVFIYVSLLSEFPETGGILTSTSIKPFRPYQHTDSLGVFIFVCEVIVLVGMLIFTVLKIIFIRKNKTKILGDFWNIQDIFVIFLFFICVIMYIGRWIMVDQTMDKFNENKNKFVNFSHIATWDELLNICLALIIFLTTLRIMRVLNYSETMHQLGKVFKEVAMDLFCCFVMFFIVFSAFILVGYLVFGRELDTHKNLFVASTTLTNAITGKNSINDLFSVDPVLGRIYYFLLVFLMLWVLMTMLNATLNVGITSVRQEQAKSSPYYGITNLMMELLKETVGVIVTTNDNNSNIPQTEKMMLKNLQKIKRRAQAKINLKRNLLL